MYPEVWGTLPQTRKTITKAGQLRAESALLMGKHQTSCVLRKEPYNIRGGCWILNFKSQTNQSVCRDRSSHTLLLSLALEKDGDFQDEIFSDSH
jgi:hypothetical protein